MPFFSSPRTGPRPATPAAKPLGFTVHDIKEVRQRTGRKLPECKKALEVSGGDVARAEAALNALPPPPSASRSAPPLRPLSSSAVRGHSRSQVRTTTTTTMSPRASPRARTPQPQSSRSQAPAHQLPTPLQRQENSSPRGPAAARAKSPWSRSPRSGGVRAFFGRSKTPPPSSDHRRPASSPPPPPPLQPEAAIDMSPIKSSSASAQRKSPRRRPRQEVSAILGQYSGGFGYGGMSGSTGIIPHASYEQIKKAEERKRALELATIRREDAIADAAWRQQQKNEQRARELREFRHNEFQSKAAAARKKDESKLAAEEKSMLARSQMASFAFSRDQKNAYDFDEEKLANNKIQAEVSAKLRTVRGKFERDQRQAARTVAIEGLRQAKENRNKDEAQRDVLKNNKIQAEVSAKLRAERAKFEREQRNEANRVAVEGYRYYRDKERATAKAAQDKEIRDYKTMSLQAAGAKKEREAAEKSLRSHMLRADADGKREARANAKDRWTNNGGLGKAGSNSSNGGESALERAARAREETALRELAMALAKEDLIEHLEPLVESGCLRLADLAFFDEKDIEAMAPKVVHRRKLLALHKKAVQEQERQLESGEYANR